MAVAPSTGFSARFSRRVRAGSPLRPLSIIVPGVVACSGGRGVSPRDRPLHRRRATPPPPPPSQTSCTLARKRGSSDPSSPSSWYEGAANGTAAAGARGAAGPPGGKEGGGVREGRRRARRGKGSACGARGGGAAAARALTAQGEPELLRLLLLRRAARPRADALEAARCLRKEGGRSGAPPAEIEQAGGALSRDHRSRLRQFFSRGARSACRLRACLLLSSADVPAPRHRPTAMHRSEAFTRAETLGDLTHHTQRVAWR